MPQYLSPGVYVEEVPPSARPIAGVGTSTAGFIGIVPDTLTIPIEAVRNENVATADGTATAFKLKKYPVSTTSGSFKVYVNGTPATATLANDDTKKESTVTFNTAPAKDAKISADYAVISTFTIPAAEKQEKLCTNFTKFKEFFGDFSTDPGQNKLAHAVYGFFNNGGTTCYVIRIKDKNGLKAALDRFATIDEIAIVAIPGITTEAEQEAVLDHCENLKDRVAILDGQQNPTAFTKELIQAATKDSNYGAIYFPWIKVDDPVEKILKPGSDGSLIVPPSGYIAGVYARVDSERGVYKAPANEGIRGALDVEYRLTQADQSLLNPGGINVLRSFGGNVKIWGARTMGGDANAEFKYISTRRLFNFLRESINDGTQFAVFEPNSQSLWQQIVRNVSDFLLGQWRDGALFGETPKQAFFVKCDAETNPSDVRERGQVVTEIGVAIVKPAEFVIFRIQQMTGG
jgi:uncharacterized protein